MYRQDFGAEIFFREPPDHAGNICSPVATVFQSASFISALEELALQAEVVRARQLLVTQPVPRTQGNGTLDPQNLFFDSESRAVQSAAAAEDDANAAESLTLSVKLCNLLNKMQTTDQSGRSGEAGTSRSVHVPPEVPPRLFAVPEKQQVVPNLRAPEARSDLVDLMRVVNDHSMFSDSNTQTSNSYTVLTHSFLRMRSRRKHGGNAFRIPIRSFQTNLLLLTHTPLPSLPYLSSSLPYLSVESVCRFRRV